MKLLNKLFPLSVCLFLISSGCSKSTTNPPNPGEIENLGGYADPNGVLILNQGAAIENGSLTYITPGGEVEQNIYQKVNGSAFGHQAQDLYMQNGKIYILSTNNDVYK